MPRNKRESFKKTITATHDFSQNTDLKLFILKKVQN